MLAGYPLAPPLGSPTAVAFPGLGPTAADVMRNLPVTPRYIPEFIPVAPATARATPTSTTSPPENPADPLRLFGGLPNSAEDMQERLQKARGRSEPAATVRTRSAPSFWDSRDKPHRLMGPLPKDLVYGIDLLKDVYDPVEDPVEDPYPPKSEFDDNWVTF